MGFLDYIKGQRRGKNAHRVERASMLDPFLYDAIDGFDSINDDHALRIEELKFKLGVKSQSKKRYRILWQTAATVTVLIIAIGGYFLNNMYKSDLHAQVMTNNKIIDIYVPDSYYVENIVPIANQNAKTTREVYKPKIGKFKIDKDIDSSIDKEDSEVLSNNKSKDAAETVIDIYIPNSNK